MGTRGPEFETLRVVESAQRDGEASAPTHLGPGDRHRLVLPPSDRASFAQEPPSAQLPPVETAPPSSPSHTAVGRHRSRMRCQLPLVAQ